MTTNAIEAQTTGRPTRAWPVLLLALPAFVAIWSGWVGLGELTGFGPVHPLPGIADEFTINTAITLPIGMEAYASYALSVWLSGRVRSDRTRSYAKWSAFGSLVLGAVGQVVYHLMQAAGVAVAPWPVTVLVACLPVAVLGMGAALAHMILREHHHHTAEDAPAPVHGVAPQPHHDRHHAQTETTRTTLTAPPNAPAAIDRAPGGAPSTVAAPPRRQSAARPHRRVAHLPRQPRHRGPIRSISPRVKENQASIAADHDPSASTPQRPASKSEQPLPTDRDALIHELTARGMSSRQIAPLVGVAHTTVTRVLDRARSAPADAPPANRASATAPPAPAVVHTPDRHPGLQVVHTPQNGQLEVIEAELVDDTAPSSIQQHPSSDAGTSRRHAR
ncbi:helix-turn-helix domain-containing protein [Nocardia sp. NPDC057030]|uniref:helix-turn-helix domain-containing protein n=1 Tax=unclassified Nocardia TaxID=2637762 RepID=UPI00363281FC